MKSTTTPTRKPATRKPASAPVPTPTSGSQLHPAEKAGMVVHQTVEAGIGAAVNTVATAGDYVFSFVKGLIKGH